MIILYGKLTVKSQINREGSRVGEYVRRKGTEWKGRRRLRLGDVLNRLRVSESFEEKIRAFSLSSPYLSYFIFPFRAVL